MPKKRTTSKRPKLGRVSVRAVNKQPPDWDKFAWIVLQYARLKAADAKPQPTEES